MTLADTDPILRAVEAALNERRNPGGQLLTCEELINLVNAAMGQSDCSVTLDWDAVNRPAEDDVAGLYAVVHFSNNWLRFECGLRVASMDQREDLCSEMAKKAHSITVAAPPGW